MAEFSSDFSSPQTVALEWIESYYQDRLVKRDSATVDAYLRILRQFMQWVLQTSPREHFVPGDLTTTMLEEYLAGLEEQGYSISHRARVKSVLKQFCQWLIDEKEQLTVNPTSEIVIAAAPVRSSQALSAEQRQILLDLIERSDDLRGKALFALGYWAGCRVSDVAHLLLEHTHVETEQGWLLLVQRGRAFRSIDLLAEARNALANYLQQRRHERASPYVFISQRSPYLTEDGIHHWFRTLKQQASDRERELIETLNFHDLRHDFVYRMREAGWSSEKIASYLGQVTVKETGFERSDKKRQGRRDRTIASAPVMYSDFQSSKPLLPLLASKLSPPRLATMLVERPRLRPLLDQVLQHTVTILQAPAGSGKTTAVNQWLHSMGKQAPATSWVLLDDGDNDLIRFWRYMMMASQASQEQELSDPGQVIAALLSSSMHPLFTFPSMEEMLTLLLNSLTFQKQSRLLILDDYHALTEPRIHETLTFFIDHLPPNIHLLLLSRSEPLLPLMRWRAQGILYDVYGHDLRFSSEETAMFLHQTIATDLSELAINQLDLSLEGWVAGLRLFCLTLQGKSAQTIEQALLSLHQRTGSPHYRTLLDYFVTEILATQAESVQRFLLQTSVPGRLNALLCDAMTGRTDSAVQLEAVERAGLFLEALDGTGSWYRYHALFAEALRREARQRLGEDALRTLSSQASQWYEQQGLLAEAVDAAFYIHDLERIAFLIERMETEGRAYEPQTLLRWLEILPEELLHERPMLCYTFAMSLRFSYDGHSLPEKTRLRIIELLRVAEDGWRRAGELTWIGAIWASRALSSLETEPFTQPVVFARKALTFLPVDDPVSHRHLWHGVCLLILGMERLLAGEADEAQRFLLKAQARNQFANDRYFDHYVHLLLGRSYQLLGDFRQAHTYYQQVLVEARERKNYETITDTLLSLARLAFEHDELALVEQLASEALELAELAFRQKQGLREQALVQLAILRYVREGDARSLQQQLLTLLIDGQRNNSSAALVFLPVLMDWLGRSWIATGDLLAIEQYLEAQELRAEEIFYGLNLETQIFQGRLFLAQGKPQKALMLFEHLLSVVQERRHNHSVCKLLLLLALAAAACKQEQRARQWLRLALEQGVRENLIRLFVDEGESMVRLLRSLFPTIQDAVLRSYAQNILKALAVAPGKGRVPAISSGTIPFEPLSPQEQRVLRLLVAGWTNKEIASELIVSVNTIKDHVKNLYRKLNVNNRMQASEVARRLKLDRSI